MLTKLTFIIFLVLVVGSSPVHNLKETALDYGLTLANKLLESIGGSSSKKDSDMFNHVSISQWKCQGEGSTSETNQVFCIDGLTENSHIHKDLPSVTSQIKRLHPREEVKMLIKVNGKSLQDLWEREEPSHCALKLADFISNNNLDGVNLDQVQEILSEINDEEEISWFHSFITETKEMLSEETIMIPENLTEHVSITAESRLLQSGSYDVPRPIRFGYINRIRSWWPPESIIAGMGLPGLAPSNNYNYFALAFWTCQEGPLDMTLLWSDPITYMGGRTKYGSTKREVQRNLKKIFNENGVKLMVSTFGDYQFPTTDGVDAVQCATRLGNFVRDNNLDGVDIDYEDNKAMKRGVGEQWVIKFTRKLRSMLPNHIISHAPQAPYFSEESYKNGGYMKVDREVGDMIDFYNIQFYNQQATTYDTYEKLFTKSGKWFQKTSIKEIRDRGVPMEKLVVGKPASTSAVYNNNSGFVNAQTLGKWVDKAHKDFGFDTGVMYWEYYYDYDGGQMESAIGNLI